MTGPTSSGPSSPEDRDRHGPSSPADRVLQLPLQTQCNILLCNFREYKPDSFFVDHHFLPRDRSLITGGGGM